MDAPGGWTASGGDGRAGRAGDGGERRFTPPPPIPPRPAVSIATHPRPRALDARERALVAEALAAVGYPHAWPPRRARGEEEAQRRAYLAQLRQNPLAEDTCARACCEMMCRAFAEMRRHQDLDLTRVIGIMRAASLCIVRNDEPSPKHRMLVEVFGAVLDVCWEDTLEEGELWGDDDQAEVEAAMASALDGIRRLAAPWEAEGAAVSYTALIKGYGRMSFNDAFIATYLRDREQVQELNTPDLVHPLIWGRMLAPESQPAFFQALMQCSHSLSGGNAAGAGAGAVGGAPREMAVAAECVAWDGTPIPCIVRYRIVYAPQGLAACLGFFPVEQAAAAVLAGTPPAAAAAAAAAVMSGVD